MYENQPTAPLSRYNPITLREVVLPPSQMKLSSPPISQTSIVELIKGVAVQVGVAC